MIRKISLSAILLLLGLVFCCTNGFADENVDFDKKLRDADIFIPEGSFEFPTAEGAAYIQGTPEFQRVPDNILGPNDFEKMRDLPTDSQDYILGRKVGWLVVPQRYNPNRYWVCTGFLVGPDLFLTTHHCIHDDFGRLPLENAEILMDYYQEPNVDPTRGGVTAGVSEVLRADAAMDYTLLRLDRPIGNTYGWLELDTTTRVDTRQSVKLISHPSGRSKEIVRRNSQIVDIPADHPLAGVPFALAYLADSERGSSGSPVFLREGTVVIGIHHTAWTRNRIPHFNAGTLMSYIVPEIQQWLPGGTPPPPPPPSSTNLMYWTDWGRETIQRANLDGSNIENLVTTGLSFPKGIAVDVVDGKMYWTDSGTDKVQRANLDGSNIENLVTGLVWPHGIALDVAGGKMYWTDGGTDKIQRANLDGSNIENLVTGLRSPYGIALDVAGRKMYWTDAGTDKIQRANLDGSNIENLVTGLRSPYGIALDVAGGKMYWTDEDTDKVQRANLDGSNVQDLLTTVAGYPRGIALDVPEGKVYWVNQVIGRGDKIQRANLDGTNIEDLVTTGLSLPDSIALGLPQASGIITFSPNEIADQTFTVGISVSLTLPIATGGTAPYTYTLTPDLPAGLVFEGLSRSISGTPTIPLPLTTYTYTVTDAAAQTASLTFTIEVTTGGLDVNGDGQVNVLDLVLVAVFYGTRGDGLPADVNSDGVVNVQDFAAVAAGVDAANALPLQDVEAALLILAQQAGDIEAAAEAPMGFGNLPQHVRSAGIAYSNVADALTNVRHFASGDVRLVKSVALLERLLSYLREMATIPETTALLSNYPNPFNPETWIPYHLATDAEVKLTIYNVRGDVVRALIFGHQPAGVYESRGRAAYWNGRNSYGEPVASGVYFYTLTAGDFTATRKMLLKK